MRTRIHRNETVVGAGLALAALAPVAALAVGSPATAAPRQHNHHVVLVNGTDEQTVGVKSAISGTGHVASYDGRWVVFATDAELVPRDRNDLDDVYLRDTREGVTILVSRRGKSPGDGDSFEPTISNNGRYVAFTTVSTNLFSDTNGETADVVVKDLHTGVISLVSADGHGQQRRQNSFAPVISGNGKRVAFQTFASFGSKDQDEREDIYVRDIAHGWIRQASLTPKGHDVKASILVGDVSDDGNLVTFGSDNNLWVRNVATGATNRFWHEPDSPPCLGFPVGSAGRPAISGSGKYVAFSSCATQIPGSDGQHAQVYRMSLATGDLTLVTHVGDVFGDADSFLPSLSRSGRFVGFGSDASNLVDTDSGTNTDAFRADLATGKIRRASEAVDRTEGNSWSGSAGVAISGDGQTLVYESYADNLVPGDLSNYEEVFAWQS